MFKTVANPFDYSTWAFFVVHVPSGQIVGYSNSADWCEWLISQQR